MGKLVEGRWVSDEVSATDKDGRWTRTPTVVRDWIRADGSSPFPAESGRYHLWLAWNCTWSQRTMIVRNLLGLDTAIGISLAHWHRNDDGWWFREGLDGLAAEHPQPWESWSPEAGFQSAEPDPGLPLWHLYVAGDPSYTGRATVPALWDRRLGRVVNNESSDILRMLQSELGALSNGVDLLPADRLDTIDATNEHVYSNINNGVYKVGFARSQAAYEEALHALFSALDHYDALLSEQRYLCGEVLTEADVRLYPTLVRFDPVYYSHFKCSLRRIADYPHLSAYLRDLHQTPGFGSTVHVLAYKLGYMGRSQRLNPSRIIPPGPRLDWDAPHDRDRLGPRRIGASL